MARCLIIACGCRGRTLASRLIAEGNAVRGTTRDPGRTAAIEAIGADAVVADPDRVATLVGALAQVAAVVVLLGSATGSPEQLAALHGTRLDMLLTKMVDTTVRGVVYEAVGSVDRAVLEAGTARVAEFAGRTHARAEVLSAAPDPLEEWVSAAAAAVGRLLEAR